MEPQIQYATASDGVRIAYWTLGEGGTPLILLSPIAMSHTGLEWQVPELMAWYRHLARSRMIVRYDPRGAGMSQRNVVDHSVETHAQDIEAVADRIGLDQFFLAGFFFPGCPAIVYAASGTRRLAKLVLWSTPVRTEIMLQGVRMQALLGMLEQDWVLFTETLAHGLLGWTRGDLAHQWAGFIRDGVSQDEASRMIRAVADNDFAALLPKIAAPTLLIHNPGLHVINDDEASEIVALIPDARMARLDEGFAAPYESLGGRAAFDEFLGDSVTSAPPMMPASHVVTVLFTDLTDSTRLTQRLGDAKAQDLVRLHNRIVREALIAQGGSEIKHTGDGIMASFPSASGALECAIAIQRAVEQHASDTGASLAIHVGINAGEPVAEEADLFGTSVQLARRICDAAGSDEILVSNVVRELAAGKGFLFADRGDAVLRGFEEPVRLYELRWRDEARM
jgi:class 3 adenylate cyclase